MKSYVSFQRRTSIDNSKAFYYIQTKQEIRYVFCVLNAPSSPISPLLQNIGWLFISNPDECLAVFNEGTPTKGMKISLQYDDAEFAGCINLKMPVAQLLTVGYNMLMDVDGNQKRFGISFTPHEKGLLIYCGNIDILLSATSVTFSRQFIGSIIPFTEVVQNQEWAQSLNQAGNFYCGVKYEFSTRAYCFEYGNFTLYYNPANHNFIYVFWKTNVCVKLQLHHDALILVNSTSRLAYNPNIQQDGNSVTVNGESVNVLMLLSVISVI